MKPREYCCCAIPLVNAGIYTTITEQFVLAVIVGTLAIATPSIVGAATPSYAPLILAILCYVAAAIQVLGFLAVARDREIMYRRYVTLHTLAFLAVFAVSAVWIILSATGHSTAQSKCEAAYFTATNTSSEGQTLCDVFSWLDVGLMGAAWIIFALVQSYLLFVLSSYGATQRNDHEKYQALNDSTNLADDIPMADRGDPWDSRASYDLDDTRGRGHSRQESSASTIVSMPPQKEAAYDSYASRDGRRPHSDYGI